MYLSNKKTKRPKRKYLQPCKYNEVAKMDVQKIRTQRYHMPVPLDVQGAAGKGKLDKKVVQMEEDVSEFYFNSRSQWRETYTVNDTKTGYSDIYFQTDYNCGFGLRQEEGEEYQH